MAFNFLVHLGCNIDCFYTFLMSFKEELNDEDGLIMEK